MTHKPQRHCDHECVCNKYIDYTNTGATPGRKCNGETWCFKPCSHDTRSRPPSNIATMIMKLHADIIENPLSWEEICGSLEDIASAAKAPAPAQDGMTPEQRTGGVTMIKSLIHPNRCDNGCRFFDIQTHLLQIGIGYCWVTGGDKFILHNDYESLKSRGCPSYGCIVCEDSYPHIPASTIVAHAKKEERERVLDEVIKIVMAYERKPKYDYEVTLCSVIGESLETLRTPGGKLPDQYSSQGRLHS